MIRQSIFFDYQIRIVKQQMYNKSLQKKERKMSIMQRDYDFVFKLLLIGNSGVGKSSILTRFADDIFAQNHLPTIGVDFKIRTIQTDGSIVKLQMWDTAGQEKFKTIVSAYYKGAHGIILVYDITDRQSFKDVQNWIDEAEKYSREGAVKILLGNKKDLEKDRQVTYREGKQYADSLGMEYIETSAKDKIHIDESFRKLVMGIKKTISFAPKKTTKNIIGITKHPQKKDYRTCC